MNQSKYWQYFLFVFLVLISCSKDENFPVKEVVLTFDDAPNFPENTGKILDILKKHHARATFFCIGQSLREYPDLAYRIATEQSMGNHTYTHIDVGNSSLPRIYKPEILRTQLLIDSLQPGNKRYFRPPFSELTSKQKLTLLSNGYEVVMWDLSAEEWDNSVSTQEVIDYFHHNLFSKSRIPVILFHLSNSTVEALDILLYEFEEKDIHIISLDEYRSR